MKPKTAAEPGTNSELLLVHSEHEEVTRQLFFFSPVKKNGPDKKLASKCGTAGIENRPQAKAERKQNASSDWRRKEGSKGRMEKWAEATD